MHCPDTFEPHIPSNATSGLPLPDEKGSHPASSPVTSTSCNPFGLQPNRVPFPSLPEEQDPSPCGNQGHFSLLPLQSLFPTGLVDSLCSRVAPCVTLHGRCILPAGCECVTKCRCHLLSVRCCVFGHLKSVRACSAFFSKRVSGGGG